MTATEDEKYLKMLKQMGLAAEQVPDDMRDTLYSKLGLVKPESTSQSTAPPEKKKKKPEVVEKERKEKKAKVREERQEQVKMAQIKEADILHTDAVGGSEKLTLGDLF